MRLKIVFHWDYRNIFVDDLTTNSQWAMKFCDTIERRGLQFSGDTKPQLMEQLENKLDAVGKQDVPRCIFGVESMDDLMNMTSIA